MGAQALLSEDEPASIDLTKVASACPPAGIVSRTVLQSPGLRVVLLAFAEGQELTEHSSSRRALIQVLGGRCEFQLAGKWLSLGAGSLVHLPPDAPHALRATADCSVLLTLASPAKPRAGSE